MPTDTMKALFYPFNRGMPGLSGEKEAIALFLGSEYSEELKNFSDIDLIQPFFPLAENLEKHGFKVLKNIPDSKEYSLVMCNLPKQADEAKYMLASALSVLEKGGTLLGVAANKAGSGRIGKWFHQAEIEHCQSASKSKCKIFWGVKSYEDIPETITGWLDAGRKKSITLDGVEYTTQAGIFGWNKVDAGSKLLMKNVLGSGGLFGYGADFGCGYGYLSKGIVEAFPDIKRLYCIDADLKAVECCRENLSEKEICKFIWTDLTNPANSPKGLDFIVMNPPFHDGKATDSAIGAGFIKTAGKALKPGGVLFMVANTHLPYEKVLKERFKSVNRIAQADGFKVFCCVK